MVIFVCLCSVLHCVVNASINVLRRYKTTSLIADRDAMHACGFEPSATASIIYIGSSSQIEEEPPDI
jgi:hypothetical protein